MKALFKKYLSFFTSLLVIITTSQIIACGGGSSDGNVGGATIPFITTWKTDNPGKSDDNQVFIDTTPEDYTYNYNVNWGDGSTDKNVTGDITHTYNSSGTYTISITGIFPRIVSYRGLDEDDQGDPENDYGKLLSVEQWGNQEWQSMEDAFNTTKVVINAADTPDLSSVTSMRFMFSVATRFNQDISNWDVSSVTDMSYMFYYASSFNQDINSWNVSSVTNMSYMFANTRSFNKTISSWDVSSVTSMYSMFESAESFNQDISNWDVSSVRNMGEMFANYSGSTRSPVFDQDISNWNISSVKDMRDMFYNTTLSTENYDALLLGWSQQSLQENVSFNGGNSQYSNSSQSARDVLTNTFNWTISDGGSAD